MIRRGFRMILFGIEWFHRGKGIGLRDHFHGEVDLFSTLSVSSAIRMYLLDVL